MTVLVHNFNSRLFGSFLDRHPYKLNTVKRVMSLKPTCSEPERAKKKCEDNDKFLMNQQNLYKASNNDSFLLELLKTILGSIPVKMI